MADSTEEYRKGLTNRESFFLSHLARMGKQVFTSAEVRATLPGDAVKVMASLIRKKWVLPLKKGLYVVVPLEVGVRGAEAFTVHSFVVASYLVEPYSIGYWSALNYHGLSDQIPVDTFVQTTKAKKPVRFLNSSIIFVQLRPDKIFGAEEIEIDGRRIRITDPEKTVADCLDHPEHAGGTEEVARSLYFSHKDLDFPKIREYALRMGNMTLFKRLGYFLERTGLLGEYAEILDGVTLSKGYSILDPLGPRRGRHNDRWGLLVNTEIDAARWIY